LVLSVPVWHRQTASGAELRIELGLDLHGRDLWFVLVEGLTVEYEDVSLPGALARATLVDRDAPWVIEMAGEIERDRQARR